MDQDALRTEAEKLLERMKLVPPREPGEKLRPADEAKILELSGQGLTQAEVAEQVGCHQSTVSRTIAEYDDSRPLARKLLEAKALDMTKRLVTDAKPETILKVLGKLDVVREDVMPGGGESQTIVCIGGGSMFHAQRSGIRDAQPAATLFEPHDLVVVQNVAPPFPECPPDDRLVVMRRIGQANAYTIHDLPCAVSAIPPHVKITPEAAAFIRNGMREPPVIEGTAQPSS